jgi:uncharacterized protein (DUF58 family)
MSLSAAFALLAGFFGLSLLLLGGLAWNTVERLRVNGELYKRIVQGKDVVADILTSAGIHNRNPTSPPFLQAEGERDPEKRPPPC